LADEDGESQRRRQHSRDPSEAADAERGGLPSRDLKPEQDDREAQHGAQRKGDALARDERRSDGIMQDDAE
jgi:hypothetical protein